MIFHAPRSRPQTWPSTRQNVHSRWLLPFVALEWVWRWAAFALSNWAFLEVLEYLSSFSVLIAVIFYFSESGDRVKTRHYQAWQVINTAQGKGGSGGRIEALQELSHDGVPLVGVDVSSAFLQGVRLNGSQLTRADFTSADMRSSDLENCDLTFSALRSTNFRSANLSRAILHNADLTGADLAYADLSEADLSQARLDNADLRHANLRSVRWEGIRGIADANIAGVENAPAGFVAWALHQGAVNQPAGDD